MHDDDEFVQSYEYLINKIKVSLGGYVAEEVVFGNECRTVGASEDLRNATEIASGILAWAMKYVSQHIILKRQTAVVVTYLKILMIQP